MVKVALNEISSFLTSLKGRQPVKFCLIAGTTGIVSGVFGVLAIRSGVQRLAAAEKTYGGVGPILTGGIGLGLSLVSISCMTDTIIEAKKLLPHKKETKPSSN